MPNACNINDNIKKYWSTKNPDVRFVHWDTTGENHWETCPGKSYKSS